jgi:hypothetical protein
MIKKLDRTFFEYSQPGLDTSGFCRQVFVLRSQKSKKYHVACRKRK